jgi:hypothetical protein
MEGKEAKRKKYHVVRLEDVIVTCCVTNNLSGLLLDTWHGVSTSLTFPQ